MNNRFFLKMKEFFASIFNRKILLVEQNEEKNIIPNITETEAKKQKNMFEEVASYNQYIDLHKKYILGEIKEEDMSEDEIVGVKKVFDEQIETAKRKNNFLKKQVLSELLKDKDTMELYHKFKEGILSEEDLTENQIHQLDFLYDIEVSKIKKEIENLTKK